MAENGREIKITRAMLVRASEVLRTSGALSEPTFGVAVLAERVLQAAFSRPRSSPQSLLEASTPSRIAVQLDQGR